jgi:hypothetical protein
MSHWGFLACLDWLLRASRFSPLPTSYIGSCLDIFSA